MLIVGLTGSIGMGKSTAAKRFRALGIAVIDADAIVHDLYRGAAVPLVERAFPGSTANGLVDRARLSLALAADPGGFKRLEQIVHPLVRAAEAALLAEEFAQGSKIVVLEIPLLFETGGDQRVDIVLVVSAMPDMQRQRVLARPGMTPARLDRLLSQQMPDAEKRQRADFVVDTNGSIAETDRQVDAIVASLANRRGSAYQRCWA